MTRYLRIALAVILVAVVARTAYVLYERRADQRTGKAEAPARRQDPDEFVFVRSLHAYDLDSARKLEGQTVWVKAGNAVTYYRAGTRAEAGLLPPLAELKVSRVARQGDQIMARFTFTAGEPKGEYAVPIGAVKGTDTNLIVDEVFFYDDPRRLYQHWTPATWDAIARHEIVEGMNETQAGMAMGIGRAAGSSGSYGNRTLQFQHAGQAVEVLFVENRAARIRKIETE